MTVSITFLGLDVTGLVYRTHTGRWEVDDFKVTNDGHDMWKALSENALCEIHDRLIEEAQKQDYKWL